MPSCYHSQALGDRESKDLKHVNIKRSKVYNSNACAGAAKNGHVECVKILLEFKANPHALNKVGYTPILEATGLYYYRIGDWSCLSQFCRVLPMHMLFLHGSKLCVNIYGHSQSRHRSHLMIPGATKLLLTCWHARGKNSLSGVRAR